MLVLSDPRSARHWLLALALLTWRLFLLPAALDAQERQPVTRDKENNTAASPPTAKPNLIPESLLTGLPLNGRSYTQLVTLDAGVSDSSSASSSRGVGGGSLTFSGSPEKSYFKKSA